MVQDGDFHGPDLAPGVFPCHSSRSRPAGPDYFDIPDLNLLMQIGFALCNGPFLLQLHVVPMPG